MSCGRRVRGPDFRGFGDSDKPALDPLQGYTLEALAADIPALMDGLALDGVVIAAHDIGASVAQLLARTAPERIRALVSLNPPTRGSGSVVSSRPPSGSSGISTSTIWLGQTD